MGGKTDEEKYQKKKKRRQKKGEIRLRVKKKDSGGQASNSLNHKAGKTERYIPGQEIVRCVVRTRLERGTAWLDLC